MMHRRLREYTSARVGLGRAGNGLPTSELLRLQLAHARAREAVHSSLDEYSLTVDLQPLIGEALVLRSAAPNRAAYLRRPDLGRRLKQESRDLLLPHRGAYDVVFVIADGLSALGVQRHASALLKASLRLLNATDWKLAPTAIVHQGRVAIGDEVGEALGAALSVVLIGERPGLSSSDSLGVYLSWAPKPGMTDAHRNCISNVRTEGLSYELAAHKLVYLMNEARRLKLSGVQLKEDAPQLPGIS